jgi:hypothetical protein
MLKRGVVIPAPHVLSCLPESGNTVLTVYKAFVDISGWSGIILVYRSRTLANKRILSEDELKQLLRERIDRLRAQRVDRKNRAMLAVATAEAVREIPMAEQVRLWEDDECESMKDPLD